MYEQGMGGHGLRLRRSPFRAGGIGSSGGWVLARTGRRTIALSHNGRRWKEVTPGGKDIGGHRSTHRTPLRIPQNLSKIVLNLS